MKKLAALAIVAVATVAMSASEVSAQSRFVGPGPVGGYELGVGLNLSGNGFLGRFNRGGGFGGNRFGFGGVGVNGFGIGSARSVAPPYFAQFPPVYYSGIVKRPYGISPFAAPPGIAPIELQHQPVVVPQHVKNPYFDAEVQSVGDQTEPTPAALDGKTTWIQNPYISSQASK